MVNIMFLFVSDTFSIVVEYEFPYHLMTFQQVFYCYSCTYSLVCLRWKQPYFLSGFYSHIYIVSAILLAFLFSFITVAYILLMNNIFLIHNYVGARVYLFFCEAFIRSSINFNSCSSWFPAPTCIISGS